MSWSVNYIGTAQNIINALNEQSEKFTGQTKEEFDAALPHIRGLLAENYAPEKPPLLKLDASGSGYSVGGEQKQRQCSVQIQQLWGALV